ncbi:hypothetical protein Ancab_031657 [Ancistrocladus abbreviatus]
MILGDFLGHGIFNVDGDVCRFQRKMESLELNNHSVRSYAFEIVTEVINRRLLPLLSSVAGREDGVLDLQARAYSFIAYDYYTCPMLSDVLVLVLVLGLSSKDVFRRFPFDSICRFSFGLDPECLNISMPISKFATSFDLASKLSAERKLKRIFNIGSEKELRQAIKVVNLLAKEVILQHRKVGFSTQKDLLSRFMLKVRDVTFLRDIIVSFLLAGRDTVVAAFTGFFWLVGNHPVVEANILDEVDRVVGSTRECVVGFEQMRELQYLQAAVYESMRLYPPVQFDSKFCLDDDVLPDGSVAKKGTRVTYHPYAMGRMEEIWGADCMEFKPERWLKDANPAATTPLFSAVLTATFRSGLPVLLRKRVRSSPS